jgi:hypothetical protein
MSDMIKVEVEGARAVDWRGVMKITLVAAALFAGFRFLPTGTNLHHSDFQVTGANALEMCDPSRPQFIPVVAVKSPVRLELRADGGAVPVAGRETRFTLTLTTAGGQPIGPADLLTVHTRKLHLLVVDGSLQDYQHLHPEPGAQAGEWVFRHTPRRGGMYRVFADFTPAATSRGLYSFADYEAGGSGDTSAAEGAADFHAPRTDETVSRAGYGMTLKMDKGSTLNAGQAGSLTFVMTGEDGEAVPLEEVMDAYVHMVAFDAERSGFAHLHPRVNTPGAARAMDKARPAFTFDVMIPQPGRYMVWAQFKLAGEEWFQPFVVEVSR